MHFKCTDCLGECKDEALLKQHRSTAVWHKSNSMEGNKNDIDSLTKALECETVERLLGKPIWCNEALPEATFTSLVQFEDALTGWEQVIQKHLIVHDFNMFRDYVQFYEDFTEVSSTKRLIDFYRDYEAKINPKDMNCTGLACTLLKSLQQKDPKFGSYFALVSSEEGIQVDLESNSVNAYELASVNVVKRHVLICLKFVLSFSMGDRKGCVLIDSGYSLNRPIVVMNDSVYPHTGWFVAWRRERIEQRHYKFVNDRFIQYELRNINQTSGEIQFEPNINFIYVEKEYHSYESVTQKRSLLIEIKFWVIRNGEGPVAAFYSLLDKRNLSILYKQNQSTVKQDFSIDQLESAQVQEALMKVAECSAVKSRSANVNQSSAIKHNFQMYLNTLRKYRKSLEDEHFTPVIRAIDKWILNKQQKIDSI